MCPLKLLKYFQRLLIENYGAPPLNGAESEIYKMESRGDTQYFKPVKETENLVKDTIADVYKALTQKGYNPVSQIVGYIMSGDPTYITSHNGARSQIMRVERDEIIEELLNEYIDINFR